MNIMEKKLSLELFGLDEDIKEGIISKEIQLQLAKYIENIRAFASYANHIQGATQ
jgi:hypothetical protein